MDAVLGAVIGPKLSSSDSRIDRSWPALGDAVSSIDQEGTDFTASINISASSNKKRKSMSHLVKVPESCSGVLSAQEPRFRRNTSSESKGGAVDTIPDCVGGTEKDAGRCIDDFPEVLGCSGGSITQDRADDGKDFHLDMGQRALFGQRRDCIPEDVSRNQQSALCEGKVEVRSDTMGGNKGTAASCNSREGKKHHSNASHKSAAAPQAGTKCENLPVCEFSVLPSLHNYPVADIREWSSHMMDREALRLLKIESTRLDGDKLPRTNVTGLYFNKHRPCWAVDYYNRLRKRKTIDFFVPDLKPEIVNLVLKYAIACREVLPRRFDDLPPDLPEPDENNLGFPYRYGHQYLGRSISTVNGSDEVAPVKASTISPCETFPELSGASSAQEAELIAALESRNGVKNDTHYFLKETSGMSDSSLILTKSSDVNSDRSEIVTRHSTANPSSFAGSLSRDSATEALTYEANDFSMTCQTTDANGVEDVIIQGRDHRNDHCDSSTLSRNNSKIVCPRRHNMSTANNSGCSTNQSGIRASMRISKRSKGHVSSNAVTEDTVERLSNQIMAPMHQALSSPALLMTSPSPSCGFEAGSTTEQQSMTLSTVIPNSDVSESNYNISHWTLDVESRSGTQTSTLCNRGSTDLLSAEIETYSGEATCTLSDSGRRTHLCQCPGPLKGNSDLGDGKKHSAAPDVSCHPGGMSAIEGMYSIENSTAPSELGTDIPRGAEKQTFRLRHNIASTSPSQCISSKILGGRRRRGIASFTSMVSDHLTESATIKNQQAQQTPLSCDEMAEVVGKKTEVGLTVEIPYSGENSPNLPQRHIDMPSTTTWSRMPCTLGRRGGKNSASLYAKDYNLLDMITIDDIIMQQDEGDANTPAQSHDYSETDDFTGGPIENSVQIPDDVAADVSSSPSLLSLPSWASPYADENSPPNTPISLLSPQSTDSMSLSSQASFALYPICRGSSSQCRDCVVEVLPGSLSQNDYGSKQIESVTTCKKQLDEGCCDGEAKCYSTENLLSLFSDGSEKETLVYCQADPVDDSSVSAETSRASEECSEYENTIAFSLFRQNSACAHSYLSGQSTDPRTPTHGNTVADVNSAAQYTGVWRCLLVARPALECDGTMPNSSPSIEVIRGHSPIMGDSNESEEGLLGACQTSVDCPDTRAVSNISSLVGPESQSVFQSAPPSATVSRVSHSSTAREDSRLLDRSSIVQAQNQTNRWSTDDISPKSGVSGHTLGAQNEISPSFKSNAQFNGPFSFEISQGGEEVFDRIPWSPSSVDACVSTDRPGTIALPNFH